MKDEIRQEILSERENMLFIRDSLYMYSEIGLEEYKSSNLLAELLERKSFKVIKPFAQLETGFLAEYDSNKPGLHIGLIMEYDALPVIGHACGHNLISAISFGAACGIKLYLENTGGKLSIFGTPDEEGTNGKISFVNKGAFNDVDFVMMCHPFPIPQESGKTLGLAAIKFEFVGKAMHVAENVEYCQNALDACVLAYLAVNNMKQYLPHANIYGIIDNGGLRPNIIPDYASLKYYVRAENKNKLQEYVERVTKCVISAASSCDVTVKTKEFEDRVEPLRTNQALMGIFKKNYEKLTNRAMEMQNVFLCSTDIGNVSNVVPTIHPFIAIGNNEKLLLHTTEFREAIMTKETEEEMVLSALALAATSYDISKNNNYIIKIKSEFKST